jgi:hypothetical protein
MASTTINDDWNVKGKVFSSVLGTGQVVYAGASGELKTQSGFEYDDATGTLTVPNFTITELSWPTRTLTYTATGTLTHNDVGFNQLFDEYGRTISGGSTYLVSRWEHGFTTGNSAAAGNWLGLSELRVWNHNGTDYLGLRAEATNSGSEASSGGLLGLHRTLFTDNDCRASGTFYTSTASVTVATATTATLIGSGVGNLTLPANLLTAGRTVRLRARGYHTTTATHSNVTFTISLGGTTIAQSNAGTSMPPSDNVSTPRAWILDCEITCRSTGGSGTVMAVGDLRWQQTNNSLTTAAWAGAIVSNGSTPATATVDTTTSLALDLQLTDGGTGTSVTCTNVTAELLN